MAKKNKRPRTKKAGLPPGSLVYTGIAKDRQPGISLFSFDSETVVTKDGSDLKTILPSMDKNRVNWINIDTLHDVALIEEIGSHFNIHSLVLEDVLNVNHSPKIVEYEDHIFMILKLIRLEDAGEDLEMEHICFVLGDHYLISFQESSEDPFGNIRDRIINNKGKVRARNNDYLFFLLTDAIIDQYTEVMEEMSIAATDIEIELFENFNKEIVNKIIVQKKMLDRFRKTLFPATESYKRIFTDELNFITRDYLNYFQDAYDHLLQVNGHITSQRDTLSSLMDYYMSQLTNQMNQVMKTLTVIATIFIPLTFIAGIYGMNFHYMPELEWKWSYPTLIFLMLVAGGGSFLYMRKKKWF